MSLILELHAGQALTKTVTDLAGLTDTLSTNSDHFLSVVDSAGLTDVLTSAATKFLTITDDSGLRDSLGLGTIVDTMGLTDFVSFIVNKLPADDLAALTDALANTPQPVTSDVSGMTDTISFALGRAVAVTDDSGLTDTISFAITRAITITDGIAISDADFVPGQILKLTVNDGMGMTDITGTVFNASVALPVTDVAGLTDTISFSVSKAVTDDAGSSDVSGASRFAPAITDDAGLTDSVTTLYSPANNWTLIINDSAGAVDNTVASGGHIISITDNGGLSDSVLAGKLISLTVVDNTMASPSDTMSSAALFNVFITDDVGLDGTYTNRNQHLGSGGRVLQMVEYITRMQE